MDEKELYNKIFDDDQETKEKKEKIRIEEFKEKCKYSEKCIDKWNCSKWHTMEDYN